MAHICRRCSHEIPDGGLYYHVKLSAVSGFDGLIDPARELELSRIVDETSKLSSEDLEKDVYFEKEVILCAACRTSIIEAFCGQLGIDGSPDKIPGDLLH